MITKQKKDSRQTGLAKIQALRREALTVLYAQQAAEDRDVKDFREVVLGNELLKWAEVPKWIERQEQKERRKKEQGKAPGGWVKFPLPPGIEVKEDKKGFSFKPPLKIETLDVQKGAVSFSCKTIAYVGPKDSWVLRKPAWPGGALEKLASLSEDLAKRYGWRDYEATVFVLTEVAPQISTSKVSFTVQSNFSSANRIKLTLDPALTDKEVAAIYRQARRKVLKQDKRGKARFRQLSEKHLRLAIFDAKHEGTWLKKMRTWNKEFPKWQYAHLSNFIRDCKKASQRLMQPDYFDWKGVL